MIAQHLIRLCFSALLGLALIAPAVADEKVEKEAESAALKWLALVDAGKYAESWQEAASLFQAAVPQAQWVTALEGVRKPLGSLLSRKLKKANFTKTLPGAPDGEYVVLQFDTSFANKKATLETVTPMLDKDGKWKVSGYFIK
jgi:hypothetical protein